MGIAGVGYGNTVPYYPHINSRTGKNAELQNIQPESQCSGNIALKWSDGAIFVSGTPDGQSFSIYKADDYSADNPILNIKGTDKDGNIYEQQIDPLTVDLENASYVEMMAVNAYLVDIGELDGNDFSAIERPTKDDLEKADYLNSIREWRDTQYSVGNMVGYHKAANVCNALVNLQHEQNGTVKVIEGPDGAVIVTQREGRLQSGIIGMSSFGTGDNFRFMEARYADDSTTENPIIEVRISEEFGVPTVFRVNINDIDPKNATQLEMFALCSHADAQGIYTSDRNGVAYISLIEYAGVGGYEADNITDFVGKKQDWTQIVEEALKAETDSTNNIVDVWTQMLKDLFEAFVKNMSDEIVGDGSIIDLISGEERFEIDNDRYRIQHGENQTFTITDKETGAVHTFSEEQAMLQKNVESGNTYLMNCDENGDVTDVMEVSDELLSYLNVYFMINHIKPGVMNDETEAQVKDILAKQEIDFKEAGLFAYNTGLPSKEQTLTDQKYTYSETGISWYVGKDEIPYILEKDIEKLITLCKGTGEDWLKKAAKMTGLISSDNVDESLSMEESAFQLIAPNAPEEVKQAWMEAVKETGINGLGLQENGMMSHITQLDVQRVIKWYNGEDTDVLGRTVESAQQAVEKALYDLEHPLEPLTNRSVSVQQSIEKEKEFYKNHRLSINKEGYKSEII